MTEANNLLWRHNGHPYIGWAADFDTGGGPTTTSASFADIIANSAGFDIDSTYHVTRNRTTVPVKMGVKAFNTGSGGAASGSFRLTDGTTNIDIGAVSLPSAVNQRWFTTTANIPAGTGTWQMQARRTAGAETVVVCGWSLFPFEA